MSERPILFNDEMVRAILEGRKTQTRRVVKPQTTEVDRFGNPLWGEEGFREYRKHKCPYGRESDRLWVREAHQIDNPHTTGKVCYRATEASRKVLAHKWRPSIHMPRWAARILLEVTDVRVNRVQDIGEEDCLKEGIPSGNTLLGKRYHFGLLWNSINEKRGFGWDTNPWVWVVEFKVLETAAAAGFI